MRLNRREFLAWSARSLVALGLIRAADGLAQAVSVSAATLPTRPLGRTGHAVTLMSLGGEGVLRSSGRMKEAVPVIRRALDLGINYFDTAPAYQQSQDYLGEGLGRDRGRIFLASKTHDRSRDGSLRLLEDSLKRLRTDHLDLWQLHDLRGREDLDQIFSDDGAIHALERAKTQRMVRFFGITGHTDPQVLVEAARRYPFDTALVAMNVADRVRNSFIEQFLPVAQQREIGVIGMKVMARGLLLQKPAGLTPAEAIGYVLSQPVSTVVVGCSTPREVEQDVAAVSDFQRLAPERLAELEKRVRPIANQFCFYKV